MSRWPFEPVPGYFPIPTKLISDVLKDTRRFTPEGAKFSLLAVVATYHNLPKKGEKLPFKLDDETRALIWGMIREHDRNPQPDEDGTI